MTLATEPRVGDRVCTTVATWGVDALRGKHPAGRMGTVTDVVTILNVHRELPRWGWVNHGRALVSAVSGPISRTVPQPGDQVREVDRRFVVVFDDDGWSARLSLWEMDAA